MVQTSYQKLPKKKRLLGAQRVPAGEGPTALLRTTPLVAAAVAALAVALSEQDLMRQTEVKLVAAAAAAPRVFAAVLRRPQGAAVVAEGLMLPVETAALPTAVQLLLLLIAVVMITAAAPGLPPPHHP
jgi:hypothetical protein